MPRRCNSHRLGFWTTSSDKPSPRRCNSHCLGFWYVFFSLLCVFFTKLIFFLNSATTTATYNDNNDEQQVVACPDDATRIGWAFGMFFFSLLCVFSPS